MKIYTLAVCLLMIVPSVWALQPQSAPKSEPVKPQEQVGRYQVIALPNTAGQAIFVDTVTGLTFKTVICPANPDAPKLPMFLTDQGAERIASVLSKCWEQMIILPKN